MLMLSHRNPDFAVQPFQPPYSGRTECRALPYIPVSMTGDESICQPII